MTKVLLVEDDKSLREIYAVRLVAEGYDIVSAGDGEEALAMAIKERPALIISDVMMPKISGFDMLDILRSTTETKDIRVIMMTALSSEDQRQRGEQLGADKYLVKSQVGIEDVIRTVHEVLGDAPVTSVQPTAAPAAPSPSLDPQPTAAPAAAPVANPVPAPAQPNPATTAPVATPSAADTTPAAVPATPPQPANLATRVINPISPTTDTASTPLSDLMAQELGSTPSDNTPVEPPAATPELTIPPAPAPVAVTQPADSSLPQPTPAPAESLMPTPTPPPVPAPEQ